MAGGEIKFEGFDGELLDLNGAYARAAGVNHGKPTFKKIDSGNQSVMIYYWDERDGVQLRGWWVAPEVGGSNVWAMSTATSNMPPHSGWRVPWHGDVNKKVTLSKVTAAEKRPAEPFGGAAAGNKFAKPNNWTNANNPNMAPLGGGQPAATPAAGTYGQQQYGQYGQQAPPASNNVGSYGQQPAPGARPFQATAYGGPAATMGGVAGAPGMAARGNLGTIEQQRQEQEAKRFEQEEKRKQVMEQSRQERKLSESVNGAVLACSNAERSFSRVKDSQAAGQLFAMDVMKPADLARFSAEIEKGLKAALASLQSAQVLHQRKIEELDSTQLMNSKTVDSLRQQLGEAKVKLDHATTETKNFQEKVGNRQKDLWSKMVGDLVEKSSGDLQEAENAVEGLKDQSALLSSEIAEHLSPAEAIEAADISHEAAVQAEQKITEGRDNMHRRRTEVMTAINFFRQSNAVVAGAGGDQDPLGLAEKKKKIEECLNKFPPYLAEVQKIRNLAVHIGNRARQAESLRKKQEQKEAQKRKNERRAKWNKQLIQDLGSEVTLCVDTLQTTEELREKNASPEELKLEFEKLKEHLEKAKQTFEDFRGKKDMIPQTGQEIERWGQRIEELEGILKKEMGATLQKQETLAEIPGPLLVAGLLITYMEKEGKTGADFWREIVAIKGGGREETTTMGSWYKFLEWTKRNTAYFSEANIDENIFVDLPSPTNPNVNPNSKIAVLQSHLKDAFEETNLPIGPPGTAKRTGQVDEAMFTGLYRKFFIVDRKNPPSDPSANGREGLLPELCLTAEAEDEDDGTKFPVLDDRTIVEMQGPPTYAKEGMKSRVRMKVKLIDGEGQEQIGYITYYANGRCQLQEISTLQCCSETVMTQGAALKDIKTVRRARKEEYFRMLDLSPVSCRPMVRVFVQALSDQKAGYVTISNATNSFLKAQPVPKEEKGGVKAIPVLGSVRVSMYEAVSVLHEKEWKPAFLVEKHNPFDTNPPAAPEPAKPGVKGASGPVPAGKVRIALESDETLATVDLDNVRSLHDQKKKILLSSVTKEFLQTLATTHIQTMHAECCCPESPPEGLSDEETLHLASEALRQGEECQKKLDLIKAYFQKREIRFLVLGDPSVFKDLQSAVNATQKACNEVRLNCNKAKEQVEKALLQAQEKERRRVAEEAERRAQEEEEGILGELMAMVEQARAFSGELGQNFTRASEEQSGGDDPADVRDWDSLIGDIKHSLSELQNRIQNCEDYVKANKATHPPLAAKLDDAAGELDGLMTFDGKSAEERLEEVRKNALAQVFEKYQSCISTYLENQQLTSEQLFDQLVGDQKPEDANDVTMADGEEKLLLPETLKKKWGTSLDLQPMSKEQFELLCGSYYILRKEGVALTTASAVTAGTVLKKLPMWTIVRMSGETVIDEETNNSRRRATVVQTQSSKTASKEGNPPASDVDGEKENKEQLEGFITIWDKHAAESNVKPWGIPELSSPQTVLKDTVLTIEGDAQQAPGKKYSVVRRVKAGEKVDIFGLPIVLDSKMLRIPVRAQQDQKRGWITIYDPTWKQSYIEL